MGKGPTSWYYTLALTVVIQINYICIYYNIYTHTYIYIIHIYVANF